MLTGRTIISLVPVVDFDRARTFYEDVLGLRFLADDGFALVFESGERFLRLTKVPALKPQPFSIIAWQVPDIASTARGLAERGVAFERYPGFDQDELGVWVAPDGSAKIAWFEDPDGNVLSLVESPHDAPTPEAR